MEDFERNSYQPQEREIETLEEAEMILDKVLKTGHNFYKMGSNQFNTLAANRRPVTGQSNQFGGRHSHTQSQKSFRSGYSNKINGGINLRGNLRSQGSRRSVQSLGSRKSIGRQVDRGNSGVKPTNAQQYTNVKTKYAANGALQRDLDTFNHLSKFLIY